MSDDTSIANIFIATSTIVVMVATLGILLMDPSALTKFETFVIILLVNISLMNM